MLRSVAIRAPSSSFAASFLLEPSAAVDLSQARPVPRSSVVCNAQRSDASIPKLEPFSRSRIDRLIKEPSFLQKCENDLTDYCSTLEGDESYSCWRAYFELKDLEKEMPKEDVEKLVRQAGGMKSLIDCLHGITAMQKKKDKEVQNPTSLRSETQGERPFPVPDGLPKTPEEMEEEEKARMPDSSFTRLLRRRGRLPAWYTLPPDHETD
ncbi:CCG-binding protein 1-like [Phoenix dactylifera]|uniref:CCG-binding protein 1-like n=1 Tax=Phoenix dactylifera TaxID=42345 RepID=A0A8B8ZEE2_PHODC|nr:CCG-binding protein 1-like [Phoenix dactylifera]